MCFIFAFEYVFVVPLLLISLWLWLRVVCNTTLGQSRPGSNGNEGELYTTLIFKSGTSLLDAVLRHGGGRFNSAVDISCLFRKKKTRQLSGWKLEVGTVALFPDAYLLNIIPMVYFFFHLANMEFVKIRNSSFLFFSFFFLIPKNYVPIISF